MLESIRSTSPDCQREARRLLDDVSRALDTQGPLATHALVGGLHAIAVATSDEAFAAQVVPVCRSHALYARYAADPYVRRAREKPRGYAGDAVMLDYVYRGLPDSERSAATPEGRAFFAISAEHSESARAVRERRTILAQMLDEAATRAARPRVLSVACGHLREAALSRAVKEGRIGELVALDQDSESLREVERSAYGACVTPVAASIGAILKQRIDLGRFDLIYSAGLYDYLDPAVGEALTTHLFALLNPGGRLVVGNFALGLREGAFTEAFMDWHLVLRTHASMRALFAGVSSADCELRTFDDSLRYILYAEAVRREP
jgi:extracellular factor (EF) 3-hydroxypalmitic acid methyl ester biosynthesis protein